MGGGIDEFRFLLILRIWVGFAVCRVLLHCDVFLDVDQDL
jgi:hypothetical protein